MTARSVFPGAQIGRWLVLEECAGSGERRWKCRCACGVEKDVSDRGLRYGSSMSCGCLRKERAYEANARDLTGQRFGKLLVVSREDSGLHGGCRWRCRCDCGNETVFLGTLLMTGKRSSCGCDARRRYVFSDISGEKFHRLTALYPLEERTAKGGMIWHCRCDCGNELDVSYNSLLYSNLKSCGCQRREHDLQLKELLPHVDGTSICHLRSKKTPSNNTTGIRGVYLIRGRYVAKIVFQKKQYLLGTFDRIEDAADARKAAEKLLNDRVAAFYDIWKAKAEESRAWAEENPISISVERRNGALHVELLPRMPETGSLLSGGHQ